MFAALAADGSSSDGEACEAQGVLLAPSPHPGAPKTLLQSKQPPKITRRKVKVTKTAAPPKEEAQSFWETIGSPTYVCAPMVWQSERAFRMLVREHGVGLCYTPMINAHALLQERRCVAMVSLFRCCC